MGTRLLSRREMSLVTEEPSSLSQWHDTHEKQEIPKKSTQRQSQEDIIYRKKLESLTNTLRTMGSDRNTNVRSRARESLSDRTLVAGYRRADIQRRTSRLAPLKIQRMITQPEVPETNATETDVAISLANNRSREDSLRSSLWSRDETRGSSRTDVLSVASSIHNSRQGTSSIHHVTSRHAKLARYKKKKRGFFRKFPKLAKFVCVLISLWRKHAVKVKDFLANVDLVSVDTINDLLFDKTDYASDKQARISADTKRILSMLPELRTEKDIRYVEIALRNYSQLAAYPVSIQNLIAKKAWYELYTGRRIIIKEGHVARCFYFILSGKVVITQLGDDSVTSHTLTYLNRGDSFGELGVLNHSVRSATVISEGTVEFLVVTDEDYEDIFTSGVVTDKYFPFFKGLSCFHDWPIEQLTENKSKAFIAYSKRNAVLCENTEVSPWIYIIKSGSVTVLKKLQEPKEDPKENVSKKRKLQLQHMNEEDHYLHLQGCLQKETRGLTRREMAQRYHRLRDLQLGAHVISGGAATPSSGHGHRMDAIDEVSSVNALPKAQPVVTTMDVASRRKKMTGWQMGPMVTRTGMTPLPPLEEDGTSAHAAETDMFNTCEMPNFSNSRRVSFDIQQVLDVDQQEKAEVQDAFVTVQTLVKGDVFGLADLIHGTQPTFSLVSNGAECIMIDKRTYWDKATDSQKLMRKLKDEVLSYPTDEKMQSDLVVAINWEKYKERTLHKAVKHARKRKRLRRLREMGMSVHVPRA